MPSALSIIGAVTLMAIGAAGAYAFDRHDPIGLTVPIPLWRPHIALPDSLKTERDNAVALARDGAARLDACHGNVTRLQGAAQAQNAGLDALKADSDRRGRMLADALLAARGRAVAAQSRAEALLTLQPQGSDECARLLDVDRAVMEGRP